MSSFLRTISASAMVACLGVLHVQANLPALEVSGNRFFDSVSGAAFPIKGVDYYPRPNTGELNLNNLDFFTDEHERIWKRDIAEFKKLGVNAIRVYAVDPSENHDAFMCALDAAGIYLMVGLAASCEGCAVSEDAAPTCYPDSLKTRGEMIIGSFIKYSNVLGFSAGNEVNHFAPSGKPEHNAPCQKKFLRDMRAYIAKCPETRQVPVGVVVADTDRSELAAYYNCASDADDELEHAEWYGLNTYIHCDGSVTSEAGAGGFQLMQKNFNALNYPVPVVLTEFGCLNPSFPTKDGYKAQRNFIQAQWLFSEKYRKDFAGGFVFEYTTELVNSQSTSSWPFTEYGPQNYGLGYLDPKDCDDVNKPCAFVKMPNFDSLATQYKAVDWNNEKDKESFAAEVSNKERSTCPSQYPALSTFTWSAEGVESLGCPKVVGWKCSGTDAGGITGTGKDKDGNIGPTAPKETVKPNGEDDGANVLFLSASIVLLSLILTVYHF